MKNDYIKFKKYLKSQKGQDRWLNDNLFNWKKSGYFIEAGALDGCTNSNTYFFEKVLGWNGLLIEPNRVEFNKIKKTRSSIAICECIYDGSLVKFANKKGHGSISNRSLDNCLSHNDSDKTVEIKSITIKEALDKISAPKYIDYFSLDVEGAEEFIVSSFPYREYTVGCFTIERASEKINSILTREGYALINKAWPDHYYARLELIKKNNLKIFNFSEFNIKKLKSGKIIEVKK